MKAFMYLHPCSCALVHSNSDYAGRTLTFAPEHTPDQPSSQPLSVLIV